MIITINGTPGSGKSTVAKVLAKKLKMNHYSTGDFMRNLATKKGIKLDILGKIGEKEAWVDKEIDEYQIKLSKKENNFVIDGRLSWHFIPNSIKLFVKADLNKAAERIFKEKRESEKHYRNMNGALKAIKERMKSEITRYKKYYGIKNIYDISNYDIIIDTSNMSVNQMNNAVLKAILSYKGQ